MEKKSFKIVACPFTEYQPGDVVEISQQQWQTLGLASGGGHGGIGHVAGQSWLLGGQHVAQNLQGKLHVSREEGHVLRPQTAGHKNVLTLSARCVHQRRFMVLVNGPTRSQCSTHCVSGSWVSFVSRFASEGDRMSAGPIT